MPQSSMDPADVNWVRDSGAPFHVPKLPSSRPLLNGIPVRSQPPKPDPPLAADSRKSCQQTCQFASERTGAKHVCNSGKKSMNIHCRQEGSNELSQCRDKSSVRFQHQYRPNAQGEGGAAASYVKIAVRGRRHCAVRQLPIALFKQQLKSASRREMRRQSGRKDWMGTRSGISERWQVHASVARLWRLKSE